MHLKVVKGDRISNGLEITINRIFMPTLKFTQTPEFFCTKFDVGFLDQVIHQGGSDGTPAVGGTSPYSGDQGLEAANKLLPSCGVHSGDALRNQFRRTKLTIVEQAASGVACKFYTNFPKTSWPCCHFVVCSRFCSTRASVSAGLPEELVLESSSDHQKGARQQN